MLNIPALVAASPDVVPFSDIEKEKPAEPLEISEIALERTRCLTDCPAYRVTFQADGSFTYTGTANVERSGKHRGRVEAGELQQILRYTEEIGFFNLNDLYSSTYLDSATVFVTAVKRGQSKTVEDYANSGPATLWALQELLESLLETATWDEGGGER